MTDVSVVIPVGPNPKYLEWLPECIESVLNQTLDGIIEIVIINDSQEQLDIRKYIDSELEYGGLHHTPYPCEYYFAKEGSRGYGKVRFCKYDTPWNVSVADSFNFGVALSSSELVFMLGSDDKLYPTCLEECVKAWEDNEKKDAWYSVTIEYSYGAKQVIPCNAAMVTKDLWKWLGGFPPSAGVGACDAILLSILMKHAPDRIIRVKEGTPLCWLRDHEYQDTKVQGWQFASEVKDHRTQGFHRPGGEIVQVPSQTYYPLIVPEY